MNKIGLLIFSIVFLCSMSVFADCHNQQQPIRQWYTIPAQKSCENPCEKLAEEQNRTINELEKNMGNGEFDDPAEHINDPSWLMR